MMQTLREKTKHIMIVVAIAFLATIIFSGGMGGLQRKTPFEKGIIGEVNGTQIMWKDFQGALVEQYQSMRERTNQEEISEYQKIRIRDQVWNSFVQQILFAEQIKEMGLTVSNEEIYYALKNNPPQQLRSNELFQTEGTFIITSNSPFSIIPKIIKP